MAIKFKCPHCEKPLVVKDELAGKKGPCPNCKKVLTIPAAPVAPVPSPNGGNGKEGSAPKPAAVVKTAPAKPKAKPPTAAGIAPPPNVEDAAASLLADEPPPPEEVNPQFVEFKCPVCDEKIKLSAELAGKRGQCPECRNIVKVPELEKKTAKDWRQVKTGPSAARETLEAAAPEGAWGTAVASTVGQGTLEEAGVIPVERVKLTARQWIVRVGLAVGALTAAGLLVWAGWSLVAESANERAIMQALNMLTPEKGKPPKFRNEAVAEVRRAAGEYVLSTKRRNVAERATKLFGEARAALAAPGVNPLERDLRLMELAESQVDLGGDAVEIENGRRLPWDKVRKEVQATLQGITYPEAKLLAVRSVVRKLIAANQVPTAVALSEAVLSDDLRFEAQAIVGLETIKSHPKAAETLAGQAIENYPRPVKDVPRPPIAASVVALGLQLRAAQPDPFEGRLPEVREGMQSKDVRVKLGIIEATARKGDLPAARKYIDLLTEPQDKLSALIAVATAQETVEAATAVLTDALTLTADPKLKGKFSAWTVIRLARLVADHGLADSPQAQALPQLVGDTALKGQVQLLLLRGTLAKTGAKGLPEQAEGVEAKSVAHHLAWLAIAQHNAGQDPLSILGTVQGWEEDKRPFGLAGAVLGRRGLE